MTTKTTEVTEYKQTAADKKQLAVLNQCGKGIAELRKAFTWSDEKLDEMLVHVEECKVVTGAKKKLTETRTAITAAHKEAKQPYLEMGRTIDDTKKKLIDEILLIEAPLDAAVARRKEKEEAEAKAAQRKKDLEAQSETDRLRQLLIDAGIDPDADAPKKAGFEDAQVTFTASTKVHNDAIKKLVGVKEFRKLIIDGNGTAYTLEVTVKRSEIDEGDE